MEKILAQIALTNSLTAQTNAYVAHASTEANLLNAHVAEEYVPIDEAAQRTNQFRADTERSLAVAQAKLWHTQGNVMKWGVAEGFFGSAANAVGQKWGASRFTIDNGSSSSASGGPVSTSVSTLAQGGTNSISNSNSNSAAGGTGGNVSGSGNSMVHNTANGGSSSASSTGGNVIGSGNSKSSSSPTTTVANVGNSPTSVSNSATASPTQTTTASPVVTASPTATANPSQSQSQTANPTSTGGDQSQSQTTPPSS